MASKSSGGDTWGDYVGREGSTKDSNQNTQGTSAIKSKTDNDLLKDIDHTLVEILNSMGEMSQSAAKSSMPGDKSKSSKWSTNRSSGKMGKFGRSSKGGILDSFTDGIEDALLESLGVSDFKKQIQGSLSELASQLGTTVDDLPNELGKELGKQLADTNVGKGIADRLKSAGNNYVKNITDAFKQGQGASSYGEAIRSGFSKGRDSLRRGNSVQQQPASSPDVSDLNQEVNKVKEASEAAEVAKDSSSKIVDLEQAKAAKGAQTASQAAGQAASGAVAGGVAEGAKVAEAVAPVAEGAAAAGPALMGLASSLAAAAVPLIAMAAATAILDSAFEAFTPAIESAKEALSSMHKAANREQESRKKQAELAKKRLEDDYNTLVKAPFEILEQAAQKLYDAWDNSVRTISATQGYSKADVQDLMSSYAQRLRDEGLTKVVSGADIISNLTNVLNSGLSGQVAEEFAYLATKLNAAVPTQDFFQYADTYASVAANAIQQGKSQAEAIEYANAEMKTFASNVLYASRQLSGGFSSGLKDAQKLFDYSVQIANASKVGDPATISGVLTSISAIAGSVAPDLANGLVDAVVKAATGGNSSEIVALRSLAGTNASNTEFLKALAKDPKSVFTELFSNLAKMQTMSNDNFMEVAEGLSSVFGISMDAFARVDFNYLANAISQMNVNNSSLDENMKLLASGQTTSTAEQLRMAQINQYMLDEGLAYVLDNEVARAIQQHMWDEQLAREMQEASYGVELQGSALTLLQGITQTVENIKNFLNPYSFMKKLGNLIGSNKEGKALQADTRQLLELGKVGSGDAKSLYNLTTRNKDLKLVDNIVNLMGGQSAYASASKNRQNTADLFNTLSNMNRPISGSLSSLLSGNSQAMSLINSSVMNSKNSPASKYSWANMSKSLSSAIVSSPTNTTGLVSTVDTTKASERIKQQSNANMQRFIDSMDAALKSNQTYDEWVATAKKYKITDLDDALENYGVTEAQLKGAFADKEAVAASQYEHDRDMVEDEFWKQATLYALNEQPAWLEYQKLVTDNQASMIAQLIIANAELQNIWGISNKFFNDYLTDWRNYYIKHTAYSDATLNSYKAADIIKSEKKENGDAVLALADALTRNTIGIQEGFKDPVVQTNVLLAKILIVAEAIMQQNNKTGGLSLPDALSALGLGMTTETV